MAINERNYDPKGESRRDVLFQWADNVIQRWLKEMEVQGVPDEDRANAALSYKVWNASGGDQTKIIFFYRDYLRYLDLGVGRGEPYTKEKHDPIFRSGRRYPWTHGYYWQVKPWYYPILKQRIYSLQKILERKFSEYATLIIAQGLTTKLLGIPYHSINKEQKK